MGGTALHAKAHSSSCEGAVQRKVIGGFGLLLAVIGQIQRDRYKGGEEKEFAWSRMVTAWRGSPDWVEGQVLESVTGYSRKG